MKSFLLSCLFFLSFFHLDAQKNFWTDTHYEELTLVGTQYIFPTQFRSAQLDYEQMKNVLFDAPLQDLNNNVIQSAIEVYIPLPDGTNELFKIVESPVYEPGLLDNFPGIKTFLAYCPNHPEWYSRFDITPQGFHAIIFGTEEGTIYIDPVTHLGFDREHYLIYYKKNFSRLGESLLCYLDDKAPINTNSNSSNGTHKMLGSCELRTYRLAVSATAEYTIFHGGTVAGALAAQVTTMNRVNGVFERDMAIHMNIIANNNLIIYTNAATDPFTNGTTGAMINENQTNTDLVIGSANYDIGHVFGTNSGGLAQLNSPCGTGKARGVTGSGAPIGDPFDIDYVAHEMGHQYGARHTQNNNCNRNNATAIEPGSASTIMGYAGICAPNVQNNSDDYFHGISMQEMGNFITGTGNSCAINTPLANGAPSLSIPATSYAIPANTPFSLTASATDPNPSNTLTYCWEQMDNAVATMPPVATSTGGPSFRSFDPSTSPTRYFPNLPAVISNTPQTWEVLPSVTRTMNFRVVVRDNAPGGGCNDHEDITVNVIGTAGPFVVTAPNTTGINWLGNSNQTVTWNVAGTAVAPVSCANVNILISYNGGLTFPDTLATNIPNDGSQSVVVPNTATTNALIIVQCANGTFYDVSNNTFTITAVTNDFTFTAANSNDVICLGEEGLFDLTVGLLGTFTNNVTLTATGLPLPLTSSFSANNQAPTFSSTLTIGNTGIVAPGTYNFTIQATSTSGTKTINASLQVIGNLTGPLTLTSPTNGITGISSPVVLTWSTIAGANYGIVLSDNPALSTIIESNANVGTNSYTTGSLTANTTYYWAVSAYNSCDTLLSPVFSFTTANCALYNSTNIPVVISASGTPTITSNLIISGSTGTIADLNVFSLSGTHSYIQDLTFTLTSPTGTSVILLDQICASQNNFNIQFDDAAPNNNYPCPPTDGASYIPEEALAAFIGEDANGTWILTVSDGANQDGGQLNAWGIEICYNQPVTCTTLFDTTQISACDSAQASGTWFFASTNVTDTLIASTTCDSIVTFEITVFGKDTVYGNRFECAGSPAFYNVTDTLISSNLNQNLCDSFFFDIVSFLGPDTTSISSFDCAGSPSAYNTIDTFTVLNTNQLGCDSFFIDYRTHLPPDSTAIIVDTLCSAPGFFGGLQLSASNTFSNQFGCDSIVETYNFFAPSEITADTSTSCDPLAVGLFIDTLSNQFGCDSIHSSLITLLPASTSNASITACDSIMVNGNTYYLSQTIQDTLIASNGCDSIHTTNLTINFSSPETIINQTTCSAASVGSSSVTLTNAAGCDSVVTTNTTLLNGGAGTVLINACDSTIVNGTTYFTSTIFNDTLIGGASNGCDSIITYDITINNSVSSNSPILACDSAFISGTWYFSSQLITQNFTGSNTCDSTHTINLTINNSVATSSTVVACDSALVNGTWYFSSQQIINTFTAGNTCDSTHIVNLSINFSSTETIINQTTCSAASVGSSSVTLTNAAGCDSVVTTVTSLVTGTSGNATITSCDSAQVNGIWYFSSTSVNDTLASGATNGCDSIVTYAITINNSISTNSTVTVCDSALVNGTWYFSSQQVVNTFNTSNACDSVHTVTLTINFSSLGTVVNQTTCDAAQVGAVSVTLTNAAGCDSVVTTNTTLLNNSIGTANISGCDSAQVNGTWYFNNTNFNDTLVGAASNGCDSIVTYTISINNSEATSSNQIACDSAFVAGTWYFNSQAVSETLAGSNGCDSTHTVNLTINTSSAGIDVQSACNSYTWIDGNTYTASNNTASVTLTNTVGCDSILTLNLSITNSALGVDLQSACESFTWINGVTYVASTSTPTFTLPGAAANGCDSIVQLNLTINYNEGITYVLNECDSYTWVNGVTYTSSVQNVSFTVPGATAGGCDSLYFLDLNILSSGSDTDVVVACGSYTWIDGLIYTSSTNTPTFVDLGGTPNGCDVFMALDLTILPAISLTVVNNNGVLTATPGLSSYQWYRNGQLLTGETNSTFTPTLYGGYTCIASNGTCAATSNPIIIGITGIEAPAFEMVSIYPNPVNDILHIDLGGEDLTAIRLIDLNGKIVSSLNVQQQQFDMSDYARGMYFIELVKDEQQRAIVKVVLK